MWPSIKNRAPIQQLFTECSLGADYYVMYWGYKLPEHAEDPNSLLLHVDAKMKLHSVLS